MKKEWSSFLKNWWLIVVVLAIIAIPSLYSNVFLGSMWDPYGNTNEIPVAIVNHDKKVDYNDTTLKVGDELAKNLEKNDSMDFQIVNESKANQGLKDGDYYMVITIPQDFSKNATTLLEKEPQKMILTYTTNPGSSYIASKMDDSAIAKIKAEVSTNVTKTYAKTIFNQLGTIGNGMNDAADGSNQINDGVDKLVAGNQTISNNLNLLASSSITFKDGASTLTNGLKDYTNGVINVNDGVHSLTEGITSLKDATPALNNGINQLDSGATSLKEGINSYTNGVNQIKQGLDGTNQKPGLVDGISSYVAGVSKIQDGLNGSQGLVNGIITYTNGVKQVQAGINGDGTLTNPGLVNGLNTVQKTTAQQFQTINESLNTAQELNTKLTVTKQKLEQVDLDKMSDEQLKVLVKQYQQLTNSFDNLSTNMIKQTKTEVDKGGQALNIALTQITSGANQLQFGVNQLVSNNDTIIKGSKILQAGINQLADNNNTLVKGTEQIQAGVNQLNANSDALNGGATQLSAGTKKLSSQTPMLISGVNALYQGSNQLYAGTNKLVDNNNKLLSGANQLAGGAAQIASGASQLADGSNTLQDGLFTLKDGSNTLASSLSDGAKEVNSIHSSDKTFDMLANPVNTAHHEISTVKNNGHGMAPYMMSVGLYVCCMAFTLMYPMYNNLQTAQSGFKYWLSKASVWFSVSTLAALLMVTSLIVCCGFEPQQLLMTFILAIIIGAAFMALITLLSSVCGKIGEFILLIYMVVNLGGSAGTYPLETSSAIYKAIHPFVPFTYSVDGFRKVISNATASITTELMVFIGIIIVCSFLIILVYNYRIKKPTPLIPQAFENVNE